MKRGNENKPHVGIYGRCNVGKSTLFNMLVGEDNAVVSSVAGTTTDPVRRAFEIPDFAPVLLIDTPGIDDISTIAEKRITKTLDTLYVVDMVIILYVTWGEPEEFIYQEAAKQGLAVVKICNVFYEAAAPLDGSLAIDVNDGEGRGAVCDLIKTKLPTYSYAMPSIFGDKINKDDTVLLIAPIDSEAPAGRLILPQVQALRDALDKEAIAILIQPSQIEAFLAKGITPTLVVVDSQVIDVVTRKLPKGLEVTTFSILLAAMKGDISLYKKGLEVIDTLRDGDKILILENCLHQTSCEDIGRIKIPKWLREYSGKTLHFDIVSGLTPLPVNMGDYVLAIQCGGCMVTRRQLMGRIQRVHNAGVPITNYGMCIKKLRS
ncbi:MAG: [FeFe] hydrogenase H-cluster maturation GTPase HydF [Rikenellaceae bacterium]